MTNWRRLQSWLSWFPWYRRRTRDADLERELRDHLDLEAEEQQHAGLSPQQAAYAAHRALGNTLKIEEDVRATWGFHWLETLAQDIRYALRMLRKSPGFTAVAVLTLALGIGFSSIVFSIFYNGVLYPFPYRDAQRLTVVIIADKDHGSESLRQVFRLKEIAAFRRQNRTFDDIVAYGGWDTVYAHQSASEPVHGCVMTPNAIGFWGVPPLLGRGFTQHDAQPNASPVVLLSYAFWKSAFQADGSVIGATITLNNQPRTVIGVMPRRFLLFGADVYVPVSWNRPEPQSFAEAEDNNQPMYFFATGRIKPHVSLDTAAADLQVVATQLARLDPNDYPKHFQMSARPMNDVIVANFRQTMILLIAAVVLLLLISSSNVASLLLTHHSARSREIGIRTALGASRGRLIRQLFVESLLLGFCGCLAGSLLAYSGLQIVTLVPGISVPGEADMSLNLPVLIFAVGISLLTALLFGLSPALIAVKRDLRSNLQTAGVNVNASRGGARIRAGLVVGQVALSTLLLVFAGLMIRSFLRLSSFDPGIHTQGLLYTRVYFPAHQYQTMTAKEAFFNQALPRLSSLPGVAHAALSFGFPLMGTPTSDDVTVPGEPHSHPWRTGADAVSEDYFHAIGLQLLRGRLLSSADVASARQVAVINSTLAVNFFGGADPLGREIKFNIFDQMPELPHNAFFQIIGVVSDMKSFDPREPILPQAYIPYTIANFPDRGVLIDAVANPVLLVKPLRQVLTNLDPQIVLSQPETLTALLQQYVYSKPEFRLISFSTCAAIGLILALIGLFGVMSYSVTLQTQEIGIRVALGAQPRDILSLILGKGLFLVGSGVFLGLAVSFLSVRILQSQLWGVSAFDPWSLVIAPFAFILVAFAACYIPARRAMRVDPMVALRYE